MLRALALLLLVVGCASEPRETVELVSFDFAAKPKSSVFGPTHGGPVELAHFHPGFTAPEGRGAWTLGEEATVRLHAVGRRLHLELSVGTHPTLAAPGQEVIVAWNGAAVDTVEIREGWTAPARTIALPDEETLQGWNELTFRPRIVNRDHVGDARPLGVYLRKLALHADVSASQKAAREELLAGDTLEEEWNYAPVEPTLRDAAPDRVVEQPTDQAADGALGQTTGRPPDILLFCLDALRPDHMGSHGYARDTSPFGDRLAREGVRWTRAFALAPYTLLSTASLFTGLSWRDHGVIADRDRLADEPWTLAQLFQMAGYHTVAFSDNPHVGRATGLDRGFTEFTEVWSHPRQFEEHGGTHRPPEMVQWLFDDWVDRGVTDAPHLLYVHILPPHGPYAPGLEHDLWKDADYAGPVDGSAEQIRELAQGRMRLEPPDLERLVALYDGNIRRGDAVARAVFERWRTLERDRPLRVIYFSDHGEAFHEHGDFEHRTSLYDEQLRVPVVFWPRAAWSHLEEKADALHASTELMPLLLRRAGVGLPDGSSWPAYFRRAWREPGRSERRTLLVRTDARTRRFGLRRADELLVFGGVTEQKLYDLAADPEARENLRAERADRYARRLAALRAVLQRRPAPQAPDAEYDEEDLNRLKSIGYGH